jgi:RNA-directed DNA polymerase
LEKDVIQKSNMHVDGKSDGRAVPTKCPNKSGNPLAEGMEGSRSAEENTEQTTASQTQSWGEALSGLRGVREAAKKDKRLQFTALLHHVSVLLLESSFYALKRDAAPGQIPRFTQNHPPASLCQAESAGRRSFEDADIGPWRSSGNG